MPIYTYRCEACEDEFDEFAKLEHYQDPQPCPNCGTTSKRILGDPPGVVFKGEGWMTKGMRVAKQMRDKNARLDRKMAERKQDGDLPSLVPNVNGERTESWSDAAKLAADKGRDPSGYERLATSRDKSR